MKRQHILKQMGVMVLSAVLSLTPAMQVAAAVPEDGTQILETEDSAEADTASATQEESTGEEAQPAETEVTPTKEVTASPEPETEESTAQTPEESTAETTTETTEETTEESTEQKTEENTAETTEESTTETTGEEDAEDAAKQEDAAGAGNANALTLSDTEGQEAEDPDAQQASENQQVQAQDADTADDQSGYDINKPVIEDVEIIQTGQTLTTEDSVEIRVKAYDVESEVASVTVSLGFENETETITWTESLDLHYDDAIKCYVGVYSLSQVIGVTGFIENLTVIDSVGNYVLVSRGDEDSILDRDACKFQIYQEQEEIVIDSVVTQASFPDQGSVLTTNDELDFSINLSAQLEERFQYNLYAGFCNEQTGEMFSVYLTPAGDGTYSGQETIYEYISEGKWTLDEIYVSYRENDYFLNTDALGDLSVYWFEIGQQEDFEEQTPVESVWLEQCGEILAPGDMINVQVKVTGGEEVWGTWAEARFMPAEDVRTGIQIELTYNPATQMFEGEYQLEEDIYPTEWILDGIILYDQENHTTSYYWPEGIEQEDCFFFVKNGDTIVIPTLNADISFMEADSSGQYTEAASFHLTDILRRTTYAEAGILPPEVTSVPEGLNFAGWADEDGNLFAGDKLLLYDTDETYYALYDQKMITVSYSYCDSSNNYSYGDITVYAPQNVTYGELKTLIKEKLPDISDQVSEEMGYQGWDILSSYPDKDIVPINETNLFVSANYENTLVYLNYNMLNKDGTGTKSVQEEVYLKEGSTIDDLKQMIVETPYPEDGYQDIQFVSWELPDFWQDEDVLSGVNWITVNAVYEKNVVAANFSYTNENGYYSTGLRKVFLFEKGSTYADLIEQISNVPAPEDMSQKLGFRGWTLNLDSSENTPLKSFETVYPTADYENTLVEIHYSYVNSKGEYETKTAEYQLPTGSTGKAVKQLTADLELPETYGNLKFEGWEFPAWFTDDTELADMYVLSLTADYGEPVVFLNYQYVRENMGIMQNHTDIVQIKEGTTYKALMETIAKRAPSDGLDSDKVQWNYTGNYYPDDPVSNLNTVTVEASYEGFQNVYVDMSYVGEDGYSTDTQYMLFVEDGTTYEKLRETLNAEPLPEQYPDIEFQGWRIYGQEEGVINDTSTLTMVAQYNKFVVHFIVDNRIADYEYTSDIPDDMEWNTDHIVLMDAGTRLTLPTELGGYKDITWLGWRPDDFFTVYHHLIFYGYGEKDGSVPEDPETPTDPTDPETPVDPETPEEPTDPETPVVPETPEDTSRLPEELENVVVQEITAAQPGQTVTVDMQSATVVTREMLGAAKGKDVNIQLNLGGYSWTINGMDIMASDLSDIDLEVKQNTGAIPNRVIQSMAGDNPVRQLSLTHNGNFGFRASLTINVGSENSGKYGNLYYYDSTGKMVFMNAGVIDANGNVTLSFSHASEYLLVVNDRVMSNDDIPADLRQGTNTSGGANTTTVSTKSAAAANTADATPTAWAGVFLLSALGLALAGAGAYQKRRRA